MFEILDAIIATAASQANLTKGLSGVYLDQAPRGASKPYAVISTVSAVPEYDTSKKYIEPIHIQVSFFCSLLAEIRDNVVAWKQAFIAQPISLLSAFANSDMILCTLTNELSMNEPQAEDEALASKHYILEFEFLYEQAHA